jgi:hypothetical protein
MGFGELTSHLVSLKLLLVRLWLLVPVQLIKIYLASLLGEQLSYSLRACLARLVVGSSQWQLK